MFQELHQIWNVQLSRCQEHRRNMPFVGVWINLIPSNLAWHLVSVFRLEAVLSGSHRLIHMDRTKHRQRRKSGQNKSQTISNDL